MVLWPNVDSVQCYCGLMCAVCSVKSVRSMYCVVCEAVFHKSAPLETTMAPLDGLTLDQESFCLINSDRIPDFVLEKCSVQWTLCSILCVM